MLKTKKAKIKNMGHLQDSSPARSDRKPSLYRLRHHRGPTVDHFSGKRQHLVLCNQCQYLTQVVDISLRKGYGRTIVDSEVCLIQNLVITKFGRY